MIDGYYKCPSIIYEKTDEGCSIINEATHVYTDKWCTNIPQCETLEDPILPSCW